MFADIFLQLLPESGVIANLFTGCADGDESSEDFDIPQCFLQLIIASTEFPFARLAAVHFLFQRQRGGDPCQELNAVHRFSDVIIRSRSKSGLEIREIGFGRDHDDWNIAKMWTALDPATGFDSVKLRHEDVHQNQVDLGGRLPAVHVEHGERSLCRVCAQEVRMAGLPKDCPKKYQLVWRVVDNKNAHADSCQALAHGMRAITFQYSRCRLGYLSLARTRSLICLPSTGWPTTRTITAFITAPISFRELAPVSCMTASTTVESCSGERA